VSPTISEPVGSRDRRALSAYSAGLALRAIGLRRSLRVAVLCATAAAATIAAIRTPRLHYTGLASTSNLDAVIVLGGVVLAAWAGVVLTHLVVSRPLDRHEPAVEPAGVLAFAFAAAFGLGFGFVPACSPMGDGSPAYSRCRPLAYTPDTSPRSARSTCPPPW
jgi:purine-cytosine permease-like protein